MIRVAALAACLALACPALAEPARIPLAGAVEKPLSLSAADLEALGPVTASWRAHGAAHEVYGVPLEKLLAAAGFAPGPSGKAVAPREKRPGWKKVLARDGRGRVPGSLHVRGAVARDGADSRSARVENGRQAAARDDGTVPAGGAH